MSTRLRRAGKGVGRAAVHACAAGLAIGVVELIRLAGTVPLPALGLGAIGLTALLGLVIGLPLLGVTALVRRVGFVRAWWAEVREPGASRVGALVRAVLAVLVVAAIWLVAFRLVAWSHGRFNAPKAAGLLLATVIAVAGLVIAIAAAGVAPPLARWLGARQALQRITRGKLGAGLLAVVAIGLVTAGVVFTRNAARDFDWRPVYMALGFLALLGAASGLDLARRVRLAGGVAIGAATAILVLGALLRIGGDDRTRGTIAARGTTSQRALHLLWWLADGDGDGFATAFGGVDCDDDNFHVNPAGKEIAGNGKDDNCSGGDLSADLVTFRIRQQPTGTPGAPKRNVLLISIDALRADHVGAYGYSRPTTPTIDALAARGTRFAWAISPSPTTRRAIPAMTVGRYASTIAFKPDGWPPVMQPKKHATIGQAFKGAGYQTQAILCCTVLFDKASGNVEGIDEVDASAAKLGKVPHSGEHVATKAREWLIARKDDPRPFYLWMHFLDVHNPYKQPPGVPSFGNSELDRYDAEIVHVDRQIAAILAALEETGELADTIVVITSDHGDEFFDHGNRHHARSLYNELVRIPLIITVPGATPQVIDTPVSMIDIGATLLDLIGASRPGGQNGRSLAPAVLGTGPAPDRTVLSELIADRNITRNLRAAYHGGWKLIWDLDANTYELYSLTDDPFDRNDRIADERAVFADLRARLEEASDIELALLPGESPPKKPKKPDQPKPKPAPK